MWDRFQATIMLPKPIYAPNSWTSTDGINANYDLTYTGTTVVGYNEPIGTVANSTLRRRVAQVLTAQGGAALQACK